MSRRRAVAEPAAWSCLSFRQAGRGEGNEGSSSHSDFLILITIGNVIPECPPSVVIENIISEGNPLRNSMAAHKITPLYGVRFQHPKKRVGVLEPDSVLPLAFSPSILWKATRNPPSTDYGESPLRRVGSTI